MNLFGIGPRLAMVGGAGLAAIWILRAWTGFSLRAPGEWEPGLRLAGLVLIGVGGYFWADSAVRIVRAFWRRQLATEGVFRLCRNPMYAAFILFLVPGLGLGVNEFAVLLVSLALYVEFRCRVSREEAGLRREFGAEFERYFRRTPRLVPKFRRAGAA